MIISSVVLLQCRAPIGNGGNNCINTVMGETIAPATWRWGKRMYLQHGHGGNGCTCNMAMGETIVPATWPWGKQSYLQHGHGGNNDTQEQCSSFQQLRFHPGIVLIPIVTDYIVTAAALLFTHPVLFLFVKF